MARRAFVISPIGEPGSDVREHADDVFKWIIKPAMDQCGIEAVRSDHLTEPGTISQQMLKEILSDDLCIAVLTGHNPNVFYELAIAHAANRPVILLAEQGEILPFDVKDLRCVTYRYSPTPFAEGEYARQVVEHVRALDATGWKITPPFGDGFAAREDPHRFAFFPRADEWGTSRAWERLLEETDTVFDVMGLSLRGWGRESARETLMEKAGNGCAIRLMVMDPSNPALQQSINEAIEDESIDLLCRTIGEMSDVFRGLADTQESVEFRTIRVGCPHMQVARTDRYAICIPYMFSAGPEVSPLIRCSSEHELYAAVVREFEALWAANPPAAIAAA
jgi:hypothetical protein